MLKRPSTESSHESTKRTRFEEDSSQQQQLVAVSNTSTTLTTFAQSNNIQEKKIKRRSGLQDTNMLLSGHEGAVFSLAFDSTGKSLCSSSQDSKICKFCVKICY